MLKIQSDEQNTLAYLERIRKYYGGAKMENRK